MADVLVLVRDHGAATIPAAAPNDVDLFCEERVGGADHGADVEIVLPVLDGNVEFVAAGIKLGDDRVVLPVAVLVQDVAAVAIFEKLGIPVIAGRPLALPRPHAHFVLRFLRFLRLVRFWLGRVLN